MLYSAEDITEFIIQYVDSVRNYEVFDVKTPDDLYKLFVFCHLFSWGVLLYKMQYSL